MLIHPPASVWRAAEKVPVPSSTVETMVEPSAETAAANVLSQLDADRYSVPPAFVHRKTVPCSTPTTTDPSSDTPRAHTEYDVVLTDGISMNDASWANAPPVMPNPAIAATLGKIRILGTLIISTLSVLGCFGFSVFVSRSRSVHRAGTPVYRKTTPVLEQRRQVRNERGRNVGFGDAAVGAFGNGGGAKGIGVEK